MCLTHSFLSMNTIPRRGRRTKAINAVAPNRVFMRRRTSDWEKFGNAESGSVREFAAVLQ